MKTCIYRGVKLSLRNADNFTDEGREQAKRVSNRMLSKTGSDPNSMHLIFTKDGFLCPDSKANGKVLVLRGTRSGGGTFWISKEQNRENIILTCVLVGLFLIGILFEY